MRERPIIFNTAMVKAILEGRKTQTRRLVKEKLISEQAEFESGNRPNVIHSEPSLKYYIDNSCPFGQVGDHLWVRETFCIGSIEEQDHYQGWPKPLYVYQDGDPKQYPIHKEWCLSEGISFDDVQWKPSIHMPRSACRIVLEITNIRVERLLSISESDCVKEGIGSSLLRDCKKPKFMQLWEEIYGEGTCLDNPWVWVIEFKVIQGGKNE
ncbi:hypothetical protein [Acinetobacter baumannii]|uniref:hypothetical protein n=1 Tax=Acinetobacter baumannii TaxID=470 RepID=UPI000D69380F|nr:hypothetical protein [Acinetobacter baumannii]